jgi:hypothetical protein
MSTALASPAHSAEDDQIIAAFTSIREGIVASRQTIAEDMFVSVFLPFFLNAPDVDKRITMQTWYGIAGGAFNEVNVLDRAGKVIFAVPPVMSNRLVAPISREGGQALSSLLKHAARRDQLIPGTGSSLLTEGLKRFDFISDQADDVHREYRDRWDAIIARYASSKNAGGHTIITEDNGLDLFEF